MIITNGLQNAIVILSLNIRQRIQHIDPSLKNHRSIEMAQYIRRYYYWLFCIVVVFFYLLRKHVFQVVVVRRITCVEVVLAFVLLLLFYALRLFVF